MKTRLLQLAKVVVALFLATCPAVATETSLVRFALWSAADPGTVDAVFRQDIEPLLRRHGLPLSATAPRPVPEGLHTWLLDTTSPVAFALARKALDADAAWQQALARAAEALKVEGSLRHRLELYTTPALPPTPLDVEPQGYWRAYTERDGLPHGQVSGIAEGPEGSLWIAYYGAGVVRFDGQIATTYTIADGLPSNRVQAVYCDRSGTLWAGTDAGLARWGDGRWQQVSVGDQEPYVWDILEDHEGRLWLASIQSGVFWFDGEWHQLSTAQGFPHDIVVSIAEGVDGSLWFATFGAGVVRYADGDITQYTTRDGLVEDVLLRVFSDSAGRIWAGGWTSGLSVFADGAWRSFTEEDGLGENSVRQIGQDADGYLWLGHDAGISTVSLPKEAIPERLAWQRYRDVDGLTPILVAGLVTGADGSVWIGGVGGIARYARREALRYTMASGLPGDRMWPGALVADSSGHVWVGTRGAGLLEFDGQRWLHHGVAQGLPATITSIAWSPEGQMWLGAFDGAYRRTNGRWVTHSTVDGLPHDTVTGIAFLEGQTVVATYAGGAVLSSGRWRPLWPKGRPDNTVNCLFTDQRGRLWFGTNSGVVRLDSSSEWRVFSTELAEPATTAIAEDKDNRIWFGSIGGVSVLTEHADGSETFDSYTTADGLAGAWVMAISTRGDRKTWMGSPGGLALYDGEVTQRLLPRDGLPSGVNSVAAVDEGVWVATMATGVTLLRGDETPVPRAEIRSVTIAGRTYDDSQTIGITGSTGPSRFDFGAGSFTTRPGAVIYRYRLSGHDEAWKTTTDRTVEYPSLPRGEYHFEVQAIDRWLRPSEIASVHLEVHPDYALYLWVVLSGASLILIIWLARGVAVSRAELRASNQALRAANAGLERATRAKSIFLANLSHELRTPMNAVLGFTELLHENRDGNLSEQQLDNLGRVRRNADGLLQLVGRVLDLSRIEAGRVEVVAQGFAVVPLLEDARSAVLHLLEDSDVVLAHDCEPADLTLTSDRAKVLQILINLVGNAAKFTESGRIEVRVRAADNGICFEVADTGPGIATERLASIFDEYEQLEDRREGTGLGLGIVHALCELLNGRIDVASEVGVGTTFTVTLPHLQVRTTDEVDANGS